jgi:hypothetical protein
MFARWLRIRLRLGGFWSLPARLLVTATRQRLTLVQERSSTFDGYEQSRTLNRCLARRCGRTLVSALLGRPVMQVDEQSSGRSMVLPFYDKRRLPSHVNTLPLQ